MNNKGQNNPNYKDGKYSDNPPCCIDCNCIITQFRKRWYWKNIFTTCLLPFIQSLWKNY